MENFRSNKGKWKYALYSSAVLITLSPTVTVEASEYEVSNQTVVDEEKQSKELSEIFEVYKKEKSTEEITLIDYFEFSKLLHTEEKYEFALDIYKILINSFEIEENLLNQLIYNRTQAENQKEFIDWEVSDETLHELSNTIITKELILSSNNNSAYSEIQNNNNNTEDKQINESVEEVDIVSDEIVEEVSTVSNDSKSKLDNSNKSTVEESKVVTRNVRISSSDEISQLYSSSVNAPNASSAWDLAVNGYQTYPDSEKLKEAIELAADRMVNWAIVLEKRSDYSEAIEYYNKILSSPWLPTTLSTSVMSNKNRVQEIITENNKDALYQASINASNASSAWEKAVEGYNTFPEDERFKKTIELAADRMIRWSIVLENRKNYNEALTYHNEVLESPWLPSAIRSRVIQLKDKNTSLLEIHRNELFSSSINAPNASSAWENAVNGFEVYPEDERFKEAITLAADRMVNWAIVLEGREDYIGALNYYNRILSSPWLSVEVKDSTSKRKNEVLVLNEEKKKESLYLESVNAPNASSAWEKAVKGYQTYPQDDQFKEAITLAAERMINWAIVLEGRGDYNDARSYYNEILNSPWLSSSIETLVTNRDDNVVKMIQEVEKKKTVLYNASINASNASAAFDKALEGYRLYPQDDRFKEAICLAAERMISWAEVLEKREDRQEALNYYNEVLNAPWLPSSLIKAISNSVNTLEEMLDADNMFNEILKLKTNTSVWEKTVNAIEIHPTDNRFQKHLSELASKIMKDAISLHKKSQYSEAIDLYEIIINGPTQYYSEDELAQKYKVLAKNKIIIKDAQYHNTYYTSSFEQALNTQMTRSPVTDVNGRWVNASKEQVSYYLNPNNFVDGIRNDIDTNISLGEVTATALNVRSGNSTSYSIIDLVYKGQDVMVLSKKDGWFQISYVTNNESILGWVSASYINIGNNISETTEFTEAYKPVGKVTASVLNVRSGPSTNYSIVRTVTNGSEYNILKELDNWYQLDFGSSIVGWVSGDYITVLNNLDKDLLQFIKLSGSSGISASDLNKEIGNSGVLSGTGEIFLDASKLYNINEIYLLGHAKLETGSGQSQLATGILVDEVDGKPVTPKIVYNMFGIGAFDSSPIKSGSEYAYKLGWDTVEKSILGGAKWISEQYINNPTYKQDTLYKMRWNPLNPGVHQYATDIGWAYKQTYTLNRLVELSQKYNLSLNFDIPVYK